MDTAKMKTLIIKTLEEKNGGDIREIELSGKTSVADYFVIATGKNTVHVKTLAETIIEKLEEKEINALRQEGLKDGRWAVIDYGNIIVHIFNSDTRDFFCLEKLWN